MTMSHLPAAIWILVPLLALFGMLAARRGSGSMPYRIGPALLSPPELAFYRRLRQLVEPRALVFAKVRIADILAVDQRVSGKARIVALNRIAAKHCDFAIVDPEDARPLAVLELDDASHQRRSVRQRDALVDAAFGAAGLRLIRVPLKAPPADEALVAQIFGAVEVQAYPACPLCGATMVKRTARAGGVPFWGCSTYPRCKGTRPMSAAPVPELG
jgi:hypothetical protein